MCLYSQSKPSGHPVMWVSHAESVSWHDNHCIACIRAATSIECRSKDYYYDAVVFLDNQFNNDTRGSGVGGALFITGMAKPTREACYEGIIVQDFQSYIKQSREHEAILQCVTAVLHRDFNRYSRTDGGRLHIRLVHLTLWSKCESSLQLT